VSVSLSGCDGSLMYFELSVIGAEHNVMVWMDHRAIPEVKNHPFEVSIFVRLIL